MAKITRDAAVPKPDWHYRPKTRYVLRCCLFWTTGGENYAPDYVARANQLLDEHNLELDICPGTDPTRVLNFPDRVSNEDDMRELRNLAHQAHPNHNGRLPIIFCRFPDNRTGKTPRDLAPWLPFCLVSSDNKSSDDGTLLHEMIHAAGLNHVDAAHDSAGTNHDILSYDPNRNAVSAVEVKALSKAYFAGPL